MSSGLFDQQPIIDHICNTPKRYWGGCGHVDEDLEPRICEVRASGQHCKCDENPNKQREYSERRNVYDHMEQLGKDGPYINLCEICRNLPDRPKITEEDYKKWLADGGKKKATKSTKQTEAEISKIVKLR